MKKLAILTDFVGYLESYSIAQIVRQQMRMLKQNGYKFRFIQRTTDIAEWEKYTDDICVIPDYICGNRGETEDILKRTGKSWAELVKETYDALELHLKDMDIVITHDLIYQSCDNIQDEAAALYAKNHPNVLWLHWVHSASNPAGLNKQVGKNVYANSFVIYPNQRDIFKVVANLKVPPEKVKVVPHAMDYVDFFDMHPITEKIIESTGIMEADVVCCYPLRLDRGKQPEFCIKIMNQIRDHFKRKIQLVFVDFQSTGGDKVNYREELIAMAASYGWQDDELIFMSQFHPDCFMQTPKKVIRDLFLLSNVYIHPSKSETYSLTTQEARACKNMLVLNFDFPAMRAMYGEDPIYRKFSSNTCIVEDNPNPNTATQTGYVRGVDNYCMEIAGRILYYLDKQAVVKMSDETRKNKNLQTVFKRHIEPLLFGAKDDNQQAPQQGV